MTSELAIATAGRVGRRRARALAEVLFDGVRMVARPGLVMTPRPTTAALVERAVEWIGSRAARVADVGTGSGAVAVAIALRAPSARIWATDDSEAAVALARANVAAYGLGDRVEVLLGDLLEPVPCALDVVVANLPYLVEPRPGARELPYRGEPRHAIYAPGGGLGYYRRLIEACRTSLAADGALAIQLYGSVLTTDARHLDRLLREVEWLQASRRRRAR